MPNADDAAEPLQIDVQQVPDVRPLIALHRRRGLESAMRFNPARASTRVTVDRGSPRAVLICQAVARVRRRAHDRRFDRGGKSARLPMRARRPVVRLSACRDRAIHFATVRTLMPSAAAIGLRPALLARVTISARIFGVVFALR